MLESLGLTDFFEALVIGAECERAKPNPDPYLEGLRRATGGEKHAFCGALTFVSSAVASRR